METNKIKSLCLADAGQLEVLQGNIAFAVGCIRCGIHGVDGYPGTPSTEVIDRGLSQVQDLINVGWSVNEAVAVAVGLGHSLAGHDAVVTMKIPGLMQAGDVFTSAAFFHDPRGALILYVATDFTPSSTQHLVDPRYLLKSAFVPVFEPANHQDMLEAAGIAAKISREYKTPVVILASGALCHSEGLVRLNDIHKRAPMDIPENLSNFNTLPATAGRNYHAVMNDRMPALVEMVEKSPLNRWIRGSGKTGVITHGANTAFVEEVKTVYGADIDILSLGFTHPLPKKLIKSFFNAMSGEVYIIEDGYRYLQDELAAMGFSVRGKEEFSPRSEWSPADIARIMGFSVFTRTAAAPPVPRPPMICAGCPYRLYAEVVSKLKKRGKIDAVFGDIGCNTLLSFFGAMDTGLAMGASEGMRTGFSVARPEKAGKCLSVLGDSTECHTGLDATRNAVYRAVPGVKVVLDNYWTAMTGGQPSPASPVNLAGKTSKFNLVDELSGAGAAIITVSAYDRKALQKSFREALDRADKGEFLILVVQGACIKKVPNKQKVQRLITNKDKCDKCYTCLICPGIEKGEDGFPVFNNMCSGCGGNEEACKQTCPFGAMEIKTEKTSIAAATVKLEIPPDITAKKSDMAALPDKISLAIRGVGGQGNLFFGRVMTQLAFLAGYGEKNIVKGETHGMAQMGGPVLSTFSCGKVHSPVLMPGSADCLIAMEMSELLRPGFMDLLKEDGSILMAKTKIVPQGMDPEAYPSAEQIRAVTRGVDIIEVDVLGTALEIGDSSGRSANMVMLGALSKTKAFATIPAELWFQAIKNVSPTPDIWAANYKAFIEGCGLI